MTGIVDDYRGFPIRLAKPTGGKAGLGCNKTSSIQIVSEQTDGCFTIERTIRYNVNDRPSFKKALNKAHTWIDKEHAEGRA